LTWLVADVFTRCASSSLQHAGALCVPLQVQALGLLGDPATLGERTTEHLCQDALRPVAEDERRERFSFALASALGLSTQAQQSLLYSQSTAERLHAAEQVLLEWRSHLAACKSLHDL
jgi:hypothetical protein